MHIWFCNIDQRFAALNFVEILLVKESAFFINGST